MADTVTRLKRQLKKMGITQDHIATRAAVSRTYVNHWWNGRRQGERIEIAARVLLAEAERRCDVSVKP